MLLPLTQVKVILILVLTLVVAEAGLLSIFVLSSWVSLIRIVGEEKVKFLALKVSQPSLIESVSVEICCSSPPEPITDTEDFIGASEKP